MKYNSLQQAVIGVLQEKKIKHPNQQVLDVHEPEKDELTAKDFEMLRKGKKDKMKEEVEEVTEDQIEEARFKKGQDVGKPGMNFKKIAAKAAAKYGSAEAGKRVAGAVLKKVLAKEELTLDDFTDEELEAFLQSEEAQQLDELSYDTLNSYMKKKRKQIGKATVGDAARLRGTPKGEKLDKDVANYRKAWAKRDMKEDVEPVQETTILHDSFNVELKDSYTFGDFLTAAKKLFGEEHAIEVANIAFQDQDLEIFVEEISHSAVEDRVKAHMKAGHKVSMPKYSTRDGKPRAEYIVTDKESGVRRKYIHQGNVTKMENMGAKGKRD